MAKSNSYIGSKLDLFAEATNWKVYLRDELQEYIRGHVLEVGAGIGGTTRVLFGGHEKSWTCLDLLTSG